MSKPDSIDLRSDTVTKPTREMLESMMNADVGDDVFGEDPTANSLQREVAALLGKEAALFVPSGVMSNQLALKAHTSEGDEVILEESSHILNYESAAAGVLSRVQLRTVVGLKGVMTAEQVEAAIRPGNYWDPKSSLVCLENTLNKPGGRIYPQQEIQNIAYVAAQNNLKLHLDGARLWNASVATGLDVAELARPFDSVSVCFSKGLGAPVGSALAGTVSFIKRAHRFRKMFGGGMRQIGILAAACKYAVDRHFSRLSEDHERAKKLASAINSLQAFEIDIDSVQSNIVMFDTKGAPAADVMNKLNNLGILMHQFGPTTIRATTHLDISEDDMDRVIEILKKNFS